VGVDLVADGTWTTRLTGGWGQGFSPQGALPGLGYPGFEKGGVFAQEPDFSLTLKLLDRYYLKVVYAGTPEDRTFAVGYQGQPGELVQWVQAGNVTFGVPARAGDAPADGKPGAAALVTTLLAGPVALEFLGRYEDGTRETKSFQGFRDTAAARVTLDAWIRDRFFRLPPAQAPFSGIQVVVADPDGAIQGTGMARYRQANASEVSIDPTTGEIRLAAPAQKRYLVTWTGAGAWTSPLLHLATTAAPELGAGWFVLVQPGAPSALELRNRYPLAKGTQGAVVLWDEDGAQPVPGIAVAQSPAEDWFEVGGDPEAPFYDAAPGGRTGALRGLYPQASGTSGSPPPGTASLPWDFRLPSAGTTGSFALGTDVVPSSLVVVRNGLATTAFRFDKASGALTLDVPVFETDDVEVSFQRSTAGTKASDLFLWQGGRWEIDPQQSLEWNLQGRWNMEENRYTTQDLQAPGRMAASVAWQARAGDWAWTAGVTGGALLADSTGHRRLYGQTGSGTQASLDAGSLRPSAAPGTLGALTSLDEAHRAFVKFTDYWTNDPLTGEPQVSAWGRSGAVTDPGGPDGWTGPYLVRGDGTRTDRLVVVDTSLTTTRTWAGAQVFFDQGRARDLATSTAVTLPLRIPQGWSGVRVFVQVGTLSEDFDGTGAVRTVQYRTKPALPFVDQSRSSAQEYFPLPEGSTWANDGDGDGTAGPDGALVTRELTLAEVTDGAAALDGSATGWVNFRFTLADAERQLLRRATGWRLVVVNSGGADAGDKTVLAASAVLEGSSWSVAADPTAPGGEVSPAELDDPSRTDGRQLRVDWSGRTSWTLEGRHSPVRPSAYRTLSFRYHSASALPLVLTLTDAEGRGLRAAWTSSPSATWVEGRIDWKARTLTLDGVEVPGAVTLRSGASAWDRMTLALAGGPGSETLWWGEVEALDPVWEPVGTTNATLAWTQPAPWPSAALPLVSGVKVSAASHQSGLTDADLAWSGRTGLAGTLGPLRASGEANFARTAAEGSAHGAYEATLPLAGPGGLRLEWTERFSDQGLRSEKLLVGLPWVGTWTASARAEGPPTSLPQTYGATWASVGEGPWSAGASAGWTQTSPWTEALAPFGDQWLESWSWLRPGDATAPFHHLSSSAQLRLAPKPLGFEAKAAADSTQSVATTAGTTVKWTPTGSWSLALPWDGGDWGLTPSVTRQVQAAYAPPGARDPGASARDAAAFLGGAGGFLDRLPFSDLGASGADWVDTEGLTTAQATSTAGLEGHRSAAQDWTDLALPGSGSLKVTGLRGLDGASSYQARSVTGALQARATNLFGALGAQPTFLWYRTDVLSWSAAGTWSTGTRTQDQNASGDLAVRADLVLTPAESLGLPVAYQGRWGSSESQGVQIKPTWSLKLPAALPFDLPVWLSPRAYARKWVQDLALSSSFLWTPDPAPVLRDLQVSWTGKLLLSEGSDLSLVTRWGQQWQKDLTLVGLEADLILKLSF